MKDMTTLMDNIQAFLQACRAKRLSQQTLEWYEWLLSDYNVYVAQEKENLPPWDSPDTIDGFLAHLVDRRGAAPPPQCLRANGDVAIAARLAENENHGRISVTKSVQILVSPR